MITLLATTLDSTTTTSASSTPGIIGGIIGYLLFAFALFGIFKKAGEPTWQAFVPLWNTIVLIKVSGRPLWWFILLLIPIVNIVALVVIYHGLSTSFGHGSGFTVGLVFLSIIFLFILGYDSNPYQGANRGALTSPATA